MERTTNQGRLRSLNNTLAKRVAVQTEERDRLWTVSQDLLVVSDLSGAIINVNPAWSSVLGWSRDDLVGRNAEWLVHPGDRERYFAERDSVVAGKKTLHFENRMLCKDGRYKWLSWFAVPDRGRIYASGRDVTQLKQSLEQLQTLRHQLADASRDASMDAMTASIAHEIRQTMGAIVANANAGLRWLEHSKPNLSEARATFAGIVEASRQADEVIEGIRALFGKQPQQTSVVDLRQLVSDTVSLAQCELDNHDIMLRCYIPDWLPKVMGARGQLQRVFFNLVTNAIEAMSSVTGRDRCLTITAGSDPEGNVTIAIEDTGSGIDRHHLDRIFDPFFTTKSHGMGLGLAISRSIVGAHGGQLRASSRSPFGTVFHLTLPISNTPRDDLMS
jgi:PAS domain S-box-containing protein